MCDTDNALPFGYYYIGTPRRRLVLGLDGTLVEVETEPAGAAHYAQGGLTLVAGQVTTIPVVGFEIFHTPERSIEYDPCTPGAYFIRGGKPMSSKPSLDHYGIEWPCVVCGSWRPDSKTSIYKRDDSAAIGAAPNTIIQSLIYCNDRPACVEGVKTARMPGVKTGGEPESFMEVKNS